MFYHEVATISILAACPVVCDVTARARCDYTLRALGFIHQALSKDTYISTISAATLQPTALCAFWLSLRPGRLPSPILGGSTSQVSTR